MPSLKFEKTDILRPVSKDVYLAKTRPLKPGFYFVQIKPWSERRRVRQNNLYWLHMTIIGDEMGCTKEQAHDTMREEFLGWEEVTNLRTGVVRETLRSTTKLSVNEFWQYMQQIQLLALEMWNMNLPQPPDEINDAKLEKKNES